MTADGDLVSLPPQWNKTMVSDRKPRSLLSFPSEPSPPLPPPETGLASSHATLFHGSPILVLGVAGRCHALRGVVLDLAGSECRGFWQMHHTERRVRGKGIGREGGREGGIISHIEQYIILFCFQPPP